MDRKPLYAQFDGDDIDGTRYALGQEIDGNLGFGTREYLIATGRISTTKPDGAGLLPVDSAKSLDDMTRSELEATFKNELPMHEVSDDELRSNIAKLRERADEKSEPEPTGEPGPLDGNAAEILTLVEGMSDADALAQLKADEVANKNRKGVKAAIDARIEALKPAE